MDIQNIALKFQIIGTITAIQPFGTGHINDTFKIEIAGDLPDYLLQRVNHKVFKDVPGLMDNIARVTGFLSEKIALTGDHYETLEWVPTHDQHSFYYDSESDGYWRIFGFKSHLHSVDYPESMEQVYAAGLAFGKFLKYLNDFPAESLNITIPDFHNVLWRLEAFDRAVKEDVAHRLAEVKGWVKYVYEVGKEMSVIEKMGRAGKFPLRVAHNDCKLNNVLLNEQNQGICVIDLDTIMPGFVHYDFGDGIRTTASTAVEDDPDYKIVGLDFEKFKAFTEGYLFPNKSILTPVELDYLDHAGGLFAFLMGIRFLTDYLMGDVYYKIKYPAHNLVRAKNQLTLTQQLNQRRKEMKGFIRSI